MKSHGLEFSEEDAYRNEGRTGFAVIRELAAQHNRTITDEEIQQIYNEKSALFSQHNAGEPMAGIHDVLHWLQSRGVQIWIVTGSGQHSLFERLKQVFPGIFSPERMITAYDVKRGKPDPEPYLMAWERCGFRKEECCVVENAPLGVRSGKAAGLYTYAVNTGPLPDSELAREGADLVLSDMRQLLAAMQQPALYMTGPCSAESHEQVMEAAEGIARYIHPDHRIIFRAGVWKPRTSPDSFCGAGDQALTWLQEVRECYHMEVATEVATPEQVTKALQAGIDHLWIGARTSANPIAVQHIVDTIISERHTKGILKGVWVKNPVNEDAALWIGNIQRVETIHSKVSDKIIIGAIHRGCGHRPCWRMVFNLRQAMPDIPILLDPSHMSGDAAIVPDLSRKGLTELGLDGLMVEVHAHPERALSDGPQQIRPEQLPQLMVDCHRSSAEGKRLTWLRAIMDETDDRLWDIVRERMYISKEIGDYKRERDIPILQSERWEQVLDRRKKWAAENGVSEDTILQIMNAIHTESCRVQE